MSSSASSLRSSTATLLRRVTRFLVGRDLLWSLLPAVIRQNQYLALQRAAQLADEFERRRQTVFADKRVCQGPLAGLQYPDTEAVGSAFYPKILGSYESELHDEFAALLHKRPARIIDIGFAEGYYLIGLGRRLPDTLLVGYDISADAHRACTNLARANAIPPERLRLLEAATPESLREQLPAPGLVICDCEGYEQVLFTRATLPLWAQSDLVIECHDHLVPGVGDAMAALLGATHRIRWISSVDTSAKLAFVADPAFASFRPAEKLELLNEGRPCVMRWIIAEPLADRPNPSA